MSKLKEKIENANKWALQAFKDAEQGDKYNALNNARKVGEAVCKLIIYNELGEELGEEVIYGKTTSNLKTPDKPRKLMFSALKELVHNQSYSSDSKFERGKVMSYLNTLHAHVNVASHDIDDQKEDIQPSDVVYCMIALSNLLDFIFKNYLSEGLDDNVKEFISKTEKHYFFRSSAKLMAIMQKRKEGLERQLEGSFSLIDEWERKERESGDPTEIARCNSEILRLEGLASKIEGKYNKLIG